MAKWLKSPNSTHSERVVFNAVALGGIAEDLVPRVGSIAFGRTPIEAIGKTAHNASLLIEQV